MAHVRAYLMSFLGMQLTVARDRFALRFAHPWLVWEPGTWHVPQAGSSRTQLPSQPTQPSGGDALCFELPVPLGGQLHAGRADTHQLVINDATFSRDQFLIARSAADVWSVAVTHGATATTLDGAPLSALPSKLASGAAIKSGAVTLRFYLPFEFVGRIDEEIRSGRL